MNESKPSWHLVFATFILTAIIFSNTAAVLSRWNEQSKAVQAGVGRWTVNPETGATEFKYGVEK